MSPVAGMSERLSQIEVNAYGKTTTAAAILATLTPEEIRDHFSDLFESLLQEGRIDPVIPMEDGKEFEFELDLDLGDIVEDLEKQIVREVQERFGKDTSGDDIASYQYIFRCRVTMKAERG